VEILRKWREFWARPASDSGLSQTTSFERDSPPPLESTEIWHHVYASSFADPADVRAFKKWYSIYIGEGKTPAEAEQLAFKKGDNGIGYYGGDTTGPEFSCALPPEDITERWGSMEAGRHRSVEVCYNGRSAICTLEDKMPHRANLANAASIDLNPSACGALGLKPPVMARVAWRWA
jgi:hypothetical protein